MPMYKVQFTVKGKGSFPLDMLRYDACFPNTQQDVANLDWDRGDRRIAREVTLVAYTSSPRLIPTTARWSSFMWHVDPDTVRRERV